MPYWLKNADHGVMPVYEASEVERHKQWGWKLLNEGSAPLSGVTPPVHIEPMPDAPVRKKPGRPPKAK